MSDLTNEPLGAGRVETRELDQEVRTSFLDYAMSVIVSRALPDVRDGLKPVHRRVLYAMHEAGLQPNRPTRKSARVVGDVMGNYHPHGDSAIYDALVRLAQPFSMRYPLIDGQGYFGSVDGDPAGAMRYTECRLSRMATELLRDIDADTVDFEPNYDESRRQPTVLPARFPNLLVNGSSGIAVGMATNIPPHNLGEVVDGIIAMIEDPAIDVERLQRGRARRRRPKDPLAARADPALPGLPTRCRHPPLEVRAASSREARARPRGLPQGARFARRRHRAHPRRLRHGRRAHGAH